MEEILGVFRANGGAGPTRTLVSASLMKTVNGQARFPSDCTYFRVFFLVCFTLSTSPDMDPDKGERKFFSRWAAGEKPMRDGVALSPLGVERRNSVDRAQALSLCPNHLLLRHEVANDHPVGPSVTMTKAYETFR